MNQPKSRRPLTSTVIDRSDSSLAHGVARSEGLAHFDLCATRLSELLGAQTVKAFLAALGTALDDLVLETYVKRATGSRAFARAISLGPNPDGGYGVVELYFSARQVPRVGAGPSIPFALTEHMVARLLHRTVGRASVGEALHFVRPHIATAIGTARQLEKDERLKGLEGARLRVCGRGGEMCCEVKYGILIGRTWLAARDIRPGLRRDAAEAEQMTITEPTVGPS